MYLDKVGDSVNSYTRLVFLNELITGQSVDYIQNLITYEDESPLRFNSRDAYLVLLGLKKEIYNKYYKVDTNQYMEVYITFEHFVLDYLNKVHGSGEVFLNLYGDKQIIVIFTLSNKCMKREKEIVQVFHDKLQDLYRESFLDDDIFSNQTFFFDASVSLDTLPGAYNSLQDLTAFSFFLSEAGVYTVESIEKLKKTVHENDVNTVYEDLSLLLYAKEESNFVERFREFLLGPLAYSFDEYMLKSFLDKLQDLYIKTCVTYNIRLIDDYYNHFDRSSYPKIGLMHLDLVNLFRKLFTELEELDTIYSSVVQQVLRIIFLNYSDPMLSLQYIANRIHMNASYLSSLFNKEIKQSLPVFILELRLDKSSELLINSSYTIKEIAEKVGITNSRYYAQRFKKRFKLTPTAYRRKYQND